MGARTLADTSIPINQHHLTSCFWYLGTIRTEDSMNMAKHSTSRSLEGETRCAAEAGHDGERLYPTSLRAGIQVDR